MLNACRDLKDDPVTSGEMCSWNSDLAQSSCRPEINECSLVTDFQTKTDSIHHSIGVTYSIFGKRKICELYLVIS